jgi:hypothetical protein
MEDSRDHHLENISADFLDNRKKSESHAKYTHPVETARIRRKILKDGSSSPFAGLWYALAIWVDTTMDAIGKTNIMAVSDPTRPVNIVRGLLHGST